MPPKNHPAGGQGSSKTRGKNQGQNSGKSGDRRSGSFSRGSGSGRKDDHKKADKAKQKDRDLKDIVKKASYDFHSIRYNTSTFRTSGVREMEDLFTTKGNIEEGVKYGICLRYPEPVIQKIFANFSQKINAIRADASVDIRVAKDNHGVIIEGEAGDIAKSLQSVIQLIDPILATEELLRRKEKVIRHRIIEVDQVHMTTLVSKAKSLNKSATCRIPCKGLAPILLGLLVSGEQDKLDALNGDVDNIKRRVDAKLARKDEQMDTGSVAGESGTEQNGESSKSKFCLDDKHRFISLALDLGINHMTENAIVAAFEIFSMGGLVDVVSILNDAQGLSGIEVSSIQNLIMAIRHANKENYAKRMLMLAWRVRNSSNFKDFVKHILNNCHTFVHVIRALARLDLSAFPIADWANEVDEVEAESRKRKASESNNFQGRGTPEDSSHHTSKKKVVPKSAKPLLKKPEPQSVKERTLTLFQEDQTTGKRFSPSESVFKEWCYYWLVHNADKGSPLFERAITRDKHSGKVTCLVREVSSVELVKERVSKITFELEGVRILLVAIAYGENTGSQYMTIFPNLPADENRADQYLTHVFKSVGVSGNDKCENWEVTGTAITGAGNLMVVFVPGDKLHGIISKAKTGNQKYLLDTPLGPQEFARYFPSSKVALNLTSSAGNEGESSLGPQQMEISPPANEVVPDPKVAGGGSATTIAESASDNASATEGILAGGGTPPIPPGDSGNAKPPPPPPQKKAHVQGEDAELTLRLEDEDDSILREYEEEERQKNAKKNGEEDGGADAHGAGYM